jgi:hypothetical protein
VPHLRCSGLEGYPALTGWVNVCRAYGAHEDEEARGGWQARASGAASSVRGTFRNGRAFMRWLLVNSEQ